MSDIRYVMAPGVPKITRLAHAVVNDHVVYTSGLISFREKSDGGFEVVYPGNPDAQTIQTLMLLEKVIQEAGSDLGLVLKVTIFYTRPDDYMAITMAFNRFFRDREVETPLARSAVGVSHLAAPGALVEIEAIAALK